MGRVTSAQFPVGPAVRRLNMSTALCSPEGIRLDRPTQLRPALVHVSRQPQKRRSEGISPFGVRTDRPELEFFRPSTAQSDLSHLGRHIAVFEELLLFSSRFGHQKALR